MSSSTASTVAKKRWVCTEVDVDRITCEWTLTTSQLFLKKNGEAIHSPIFYTADCQEEWRLELFPRGIDKKHADKVSCYLQLNSSDRSGIHAEFKIAMLKANDMIVEKKFTHKFDEWEECGEAGFVEQSKVLRPDVSEITITIHCNTDAMISEKQGVTFTEPNELQNDFRLLLDDPKFSDVTIIVGNDKLPAHKSILSARSPVFAAMFNHEGMEENRKNEVNIEDIESAVVKRMLEYIYTGAVKDLDELADGLLGAAEKYDLKGLKRMCSGSLCTNLCVDSAAKTLMLAHLYRIDGLKVSAMEFIRDNIYEVIQTAGYKEITDLALCKEIMSFVVQGELRPPLQ